MVNPQKLGERFSHSASGGASPAQTLVLDARPPELREKKSVV